MRRICPRCGSRDTIRITDSSERTHHCHVCRRDFGRRYSADPVCVHMMYFYIGGFFGPYHEVYVDPERYGVMFKYVTGRTGSKYEQRELFFPLNSLTQFSKDLLRCYILDWDSSYICPGVRDGTHWSLEVTFDDGTIVESRGSNAFPPHWRKLLALFRKYGLPHIS